MGRPSALRPVAEPPTDGPPGRRPVAREGTNHNLAVRALEQVRVSFFFFFSKGKMSRPTETERCIESLIAVFQKYAGKEGDNCRLSKTEFLTFMNTELAAFTKNQKDPGVLDRMMKKLDLNSDGQLDFQEFLNLIGGLAVACHESFMRSACCQK
ncbi:Protein S100-A11 [Galemys pyrenaicus]|uniref:Protein S100-A11 n=2 Tax=Galemys pyrenaicus TaxID=202257 RepID=A0A8J6ANF1_GALPY|nr:Protein S100-A11 [Galemys pyrenaicus]